MKKPAQKLIKHGDKEQSLSDWAKELGISRQGLWNRISRMPLADALRDTEGRETVYKRKTSVFLDIDGRFMTSRQAAKHFGVCLNTIYNWVRDKRLVVHSEVRPCCSNCKKPGHRFSACPDLYLKSGKRRAAAAPPPESELRAAGILPTSQPDVDWP